MTYHHLPTTPTTCNYNIECAQGNLQTSSDNTLVSTCVLKKSAFFEAMYSQGGVAPWQGKSWLIAGLALDLGLEQELQEFHSQGIADTV